MLTACWSLRLRTSFYCTATFSSITVLLRDSSWSDTGVFREHMKLEFSMTLRIFCHACRIFRPNATWYLKERCIRLGFEIKAGWHHYHSKVPSSDPWHQACQQAGVWYSYAPWSLVCHRSNSPHRFGLRGLRKEKESKWGKNIQKKKKKQQSDTTKTTLKNSGRWCLQKNIWCS